MSAHEDIGGQSTLARVRTEAHSRRDDSRMEQASLVDDESIDDALDRADLLEIVVRSVNVSRVRRKHCRFSLGGPHETRDIRFRDSLDSRRPLPEERGAAPFGNAEVMKQGEIFLVR